MSEESKILGYVYKELGSRIGADPNMSIDMQRTLFQNVTSCSTEPPDVTYEEVKANGVPCLWAKPVKGSQDKAIVFFHGGGFCVMGPHTHRKWVAHLARAAGMPALLVDYRLAPEHVWPAQIDDCAAAYRWLVDSQGLKPANIATAGDSAGGNLAISTVLKLKRDGAALPGAMVSFSPWLDMEMKGKTMETNSGTDELVQKPLLQTMCETTLGKGNPTKPDDPIFNPTYGDFNGLPPLYVNVGTYETLLEDSQKIVERAKAAGVDATLDETEGMQHVHVFMAGRAKEADDVINSVAAFLNNTLGK